jgi:hypothetical protein
MQEIFDKTLNKKEKKVVAQLEKDELKATSYNQRQESINVIIHES